MKIVKFQCDCFTYLYEHIQYLTFFVCPGSIFPEAKSVSHRPADRSITIAPSDVAAASTSMVFPQPLGP